MQHMLPSFSFPVVGVKREERKQRQTKREQRQTHTHITHIIQASMAKPWVYSQVFYLQARALCTRSASALHFLRLLSLMLVVSSLYKALLMMSAAE